MSKQLNQDIH